MGKADDESGCKRHMHRIAPAGAMALARMKDGRRGNTESGKACRRRALANRSPVMGRLGRQVGGEVHSTEDAG